MNFKTFLNMIWTKFRKDICYILVILVLSVILCMSIRQCTTNANRNDNLYHSIEALTDSITYYNTVNGDLVASKTLLEGDIKLLDLANKELKEKLDAMNIKKPSVAIDVSTTITNPEDSTKWDIIHNPELGPMNDVKLFAFNNKYRTLEGFVSHTDSILGVNITKDEVYFDYTIAIKDNKAFITSTNPYVKYNSITGITVPQQKQKRWTIGPSLTIGYDPFNKRTSLNVGFSVGYALVAF